MFLPKILLSVIVCKSQTFRACALIPISIQVDEPDCPRFSDKCFRGGLKAFHSTEEGICTKARGSSRSLEKYIVRTSVMICTTCQNVIRKERWAGHVARIREMHVLFWL